MISLYIFEASQ